MTNREKIIQDIQEETFAMAKAEVIENVVDYVYDRDLEIFCSYMADDKDHPEERIAAENKFKERIDSIPKEFYTLTMDLLIKGIKEHPLYSIHTKNEEYVKNDSK